MTSMLHFGSEVLPFVEIPVFYVRSLLEIKRVLHGILI
jgi:hypothetical protein